jgi:hypothetical protein
MDGDHIDPDGGYPGLRHQFEKSPQVGIPENERFPLERILLINAYDNHLAGRGGPGKRKVPAEVDPYIVSLEFTVLPEGARHNQQECAGSREHQKGISADKTLFVVPSAIHPVPFDGYTVCSCKPSQHTGFAVDNQCEIVPETPGILIFICFAPNHLY